MPDSLCRVAVHHDGHTTDLTVPATVLTGQLLPSIVDAVYDDADTVASGGRWQLCHSAGHPLDESLTLRENRVDDGDLLWLTTDAPPPVRRTHYDAGHLVANVARVDLMVPCVPVVVSVATAGVGAGALVWSTHSTAEAWWWIGCASGVTALAGALITHGARRPASVTLACSLIAVLYAAVSGALAVPAGPVAAHTLLASTAAFSVSIVLLRFGCCTTALIALGTVCLLAASGSVTALLWPVRPETAGAALATAALVTVGAAPRLAIALTRISPGLPEFADTVQSAVDEQRAALAHATLTGLVAGASAAVALGALLVAYPPVAGHSSPLAAVAFTAVIGAALLLRARSHIDPRRRAVLVGFGSFSAAVTFTMAVVAAPHSAHWLTVFAVAASAGALVPLLGVTVGPVAHRAADIAEYVVLAAVVPLGCWTAGVYSVVRDSALM